MKFNYRIIEDFKDYTSLESDILYLTSSKTVADYLKKNNEAVCINLQDEEDISEFNEYKYITINGEEDVEHLKKIYCHIKGIPYVIVSNDSITIREEAPDDLKKIYAMYSDEECVKYLSPLPPFYTFDAERRFASVKNGYMLFGYGMWIIEKTDTKEVIGRVGFEYSDATSVSLGFMIKESERKKGYANAAAHLCVNYLRKNLPDLKIVANCSRENIASIRILESLDIDHLTIEA